MEELLENTVDQLQLDKSTWKPTRFGDVAIQQKQSVDRDDTELTRYVKGEHMGSEDLHLREWGELTDEYLGPAFIRKFEEDDILYGSRRTYLRKVVIAPFSGITSNTTFVIKANENKIDKRILPFIMMSEGFTDHSIKNSKGSVNPYINWKDIANYEFLLPTKDQQAQLAELLWAMDEVIEREKTLEQTLFSTKFSVLENKIIEFGHGKAQQTFKDLGRWVSGGTPSKKNKDYWDNVSIPWITPKDMKGDYLDASIDFISTTAVLENKASLFPKGSTVLVWRSGILQHTLPISRVEKEFTVNQDLKVFVPNNDLFIEEFVRIYLKVFSERIRRECVKEGTTVQSIDTASFMKFSVPEIDHFLQKEIINEEAAFEAGIKKGKTKLFSSQSLQKSLINQIFG
ncbi:MAG: type I restriction enzyme S subunit [Roseivirga sp.]|jgi:type I restriction enzyme S subunit